MQAELADLEKKQSEDPESLDEAQTKRIEGLKKSLETASKEHKVVSTKLDEFRARIDEGVNEFADKIE